MRGCRTAACSECLQGYNNFANDPAGNLICPGCRLPFILCDETFEATEPNDDGVDVGGDLAVAAGVVTEDDAADEGLVDDKPEEDVGEAVVEVDGDADVEEQTEESENQE